MLVAPPIGTTAIRSLSPSTNTVVACIEPVWRTPAQAARAVSGRSVFSELVSRAGSPVRHRGKARPASGGTTAARKHLPPVCPFNHVPDAPPAQVQSAASWS